MRKHLKLSDFKIVCRSCPGRLQGQENLHEYTIWSADGKRKVEGRVFYTAKAAKKWLHEAIKKANELIDTMNEKEGKIK